MTIFEFLSHLKTLDIQVWLEGERLRCNAPSAVFTPALQQELTQRKAEIITFLRAAKTWTEPSSSVVPIQPAGKNRPFFAAPGHNGDVFCFVPLSRYLGSDQPLYGLQPPGVDGQRPPLTSIEDLAAHFVNDIRAFQPEGPYRLGGYCLGGIIAFEIAQQLCDQGQQLSIVSLFGSPCPTSTSPLHRKRVAVQQQIQKIVRHAKMLGKLGPQAGIRYLQDKARQRKEEQERYYQDNPHRAQVEDATISAVLRYKPRVYPGQVHLFLSSENPINLATDRLLDWRQFAAGGLKIYSGPSACDGDTMLLEPHAKVFADLLRNCLGRC